MGGWGVRELAEGDSGDILYRAEKMREKEHGSVEFELQLFSTYHMIPVLLY